MHSGSVHYNTAVGKNSNVELTISRDLRGRSSVLATHFRDYLTNVVPGPILWTSLPSAARSATLKITSHKRPRPCRRTLFFLVARKVVVPSRLHFVNGTLNIVGSIFNCWRAAIFLGSRPDSCWNHSSQQSKSNGRRRDQPNLILVFLRPLTMYRCPPAVQASSLEG